MNEEQLILRARAAVSDSNWVVGSCAKDWTLKFAKGRTDADFGQMIGLSGDQIYQRRRVFETFGDRKSDFPILKWSFFYVALNWEDAGTCLSWANDNEATVAEMRAWRRAQHGEDLFDEQDEAFSEWAAPLVVNLDSIAKSPVYDPAGVVSAEDSNVASSASNGRNENFESADYAPFRNGPTTVAVADVDSPALDPAKVWKAIARSMLRIEDSIDHNLKDEFEKLPDGIQQTVREAFVELQNAFDGLLPKG